MKTRTYSRRVILTGAAAVASAVVLPRLARAAEFTFKIASEMPATHPCNVRVQEAAVRIKEETAGRVEIQLFPSNQLGAGPDMLNQLRSGALEFFLYSTQLLAPLIANCALPGVGLAFKNNETALRAMDGEMGAYLRKLIERAGLVVMPKVWSSGFRQVTSSTGPIKTPDDFIGFKIRVPPSPMLVALFKGFGASPTAINFAELYTSLQTRVVNGQDCPLVTIETTRLYEVQQFCSMTNHSWDAFSILGNRRSWSRLSQDLQNVVSKHFDQSAMDQRADMNKQEMSLRESLGARGLKFNDIKIEPFRDKLRAAGYYAEWKERFGPEAWRLLEQYSGALI